MTIYEKIQERHALDWLRLLFKGTRSPMIVGHGLVWKHQEGKKWNIVSVTEGNCFSQTLHCYYRPYDDGFVVSDCSECVSEVMRRDGVRFREAAEYVSAAVDDKNLCMAHIPDIEAYATDERHADLPAAIISVLLATAKVYKV